MRLMFKILGFLIIITVCASIGFLKSGELKLRYKKLCLLCEGVLSLKERIRLSGGELKRLLCECFSYPLDYSELYKSDCEIIDSLFAEISLLDREGACKRCDLALELLKQKQAEAKERYLQLGKLYKSIGALSGIFICILFL